MARRRGRRALIAASVDVLEPRRLLSTIYVDAGATGAVHDGTSWASASLDLQPVLLAAASGDRILVAKGTYRPTSKADRTVSFVLKNGVEVSGGYGGSANSGDPDFRSPLQYPTILSGDIGTIGRNTDNSYHVVTGSGSDNTAILDGFTVTGGNANGTGTVNNVGGGMYNSAGNPTVRNCTFNGNSGSNGSGMYNTAAAPALTNCVFSGNAVASGSGLYNIAASAPTLVNCTLAESSGTAIINSASSPAIRNCIVWIPSGKAITQSGGTAIVSYSLVTGSFTGTGNISSDPLFVRNPSGSDYGDLRLRLNSPAIDAARNSDVSSGVATDLAGNGRFKDIPSKPNTGSGTSPIVDMGAYEATWSQVMCVDANAVGPEDGAGWATAYRSLAAALAMSISGQAIHVADGTYKPTATTDRSAVFQLKNGVTILGGYAGYGAADPDARSIQLFPSLFSGDIGVAGSNTDNSYTVVLSSNNDSTAILDGFTITGANAASSGAAMYIISSSPTVANCTFSGNAAVRGGGIYNSRSSPTLTNCVFAGNQAGDYGGGIYTYSSPAPTLANCTFSGNSARYGGGMYADYSAPILNDCTFTVNSGQNEGGGVYTNRASPKLSGCSFSANTAGSGGAMYIYSSSPTLTNCSFSANTGGAGAGGAVFIASATPTMIGCVFSGNTSSKDGGAIYNSSSSPTLTGCTFIRNSAANGSGGALYASSYDLSSLRFMANCIFSGNSALVSGGAWYSASIGGPIATNCTFVGNMSSVSGGGVQGPVSLANCTLTDNRSLGGGGATGIYRFTLTNCVLWGNIAQMGSQLNLEGVSAPTITYCDILGGLAGTGNIDSDPLFVRNPDPGPDGKWGSTDDDYGDLRLQACSPVVDGGSNAAIPAGVTTDLVGNARFQDVPTTPDTGVGTSPIVDIGACEAIPSLSADAGGPYAVIAGRSMTLTGHGASAVAGSLQYAWDFNGDGLFDDAEGPNPLFSVANLSAHSTITIRLRVTDAAAQSVFGTTTLTVIPEIIYVDASATGAANGDSWIDAMPSLAAALGQAWGGQQIRVARGTYKPTTRADRSATFALIDGVEIYGGYAGSTAANPEARDPAAYPSVLSGDIGIVGDAKDNSTHVITGIAAGPSTILDGFTITGGNSSASGAGMFNYESSPTLVNCLFTGNTASNVGSTASNGGAVYNGRRSAPALVDCRFIGNRANNGGAIYNEDASPTLTDCLFDSNTAGGGGAISNNSSSPVLANCTFTANSSTSSGGAIYSYSGGGTLANCTFTANSSAASGGAMYNNYTTQKLTNCAFVANTAASYGGAMANQQASPTLVNCTLAMNTALSGSALYRFEQYSGSPTLINCIVWGEALPADIPSPIVGGASISYSDIQGGWTENGSTSNINLDPCLVRNPSPGADGKWGTADDDYGDVRILACSPVADSGNNGAVPAAITTDLAGNSRFQDIPTAFDTGLGTAPIVDMGAYEAAPGLVTRAGGPYVLIHGHDVPLTGFGASAQPGDLQYAWDWDNDGLFDDATGSSPVFPTTNVPAPSTITIALRLTDAAGQSVVDATTLRVVPEALCVDPRATGANDGTSWNDAMTSLPIAMKWILPGQVIHVAQGTYEPVGSPGNPAAFHLRSGLAIYGGYAGLGAANADARDPAAYPSILAGYHSANVITATQVDSTAILDGFTITGGNTGPQGNASGAGLYNDHASPTINNCIFTGNAAGHDGGAIYNTFSSPTLNNCAFIGNTAPYAGGAIYNYIDSAPTLNNCTFTGNTSRYGGAIYYHQEQPVLNNCTFIANSASAGGAVYNDNAWPTFTGCRFYGNSGQGGAICNRMSSPTLNACIFVGNSSYQGGAIYNDTSSPNLNGCTFTGNSASSSGGAMYNYGNYGPKLINCILWGDTSPIASEIGSYSGTCSVAYSDIQRGWAGVGNLALDPVFFRNPSPGADGRWGTADDDYGDLRLSAASPVADAGNNAAVPSGLTVDLAGQPRFQDIPTTPDTGAGTVLPIVDMGAYEAVPALAASAGGPYAVASGRGITFSGHGASNVAGALRFEWEWTGDDAFDDASGANPVFSTAGVAVGSSITIQLRVTDASSATITCSTTLRVVPQILYVDANVHGANTGLSWADAYTSLVSAITAAISGAGQEIRVAGGTYKPAATDRSAFFRLKNGVAIRGGYAGTAFSDADARDVLAYPTILSGAIATSSTSDNSYHVVLSSENDATAVLDGFTITGGCANGSDENVYGGGIYILSNSSPTLVNCTVSGNVSIYGSGIFCSSSSPLIEDCTIADNQANYGGAGMQNLSSSPTLRNCTFARNVANGSSSSGGIYNFSSSPVLTECTFIANSGSYGGAVYNEISSPSLTNCTFTGNAATSVGGAVYSYTSSPTFMNCLFQANSVAGESAAGGGAIYDSHSSSTLINCAFVGNSASTASANGGAIYSADESTTTITNCTFVANSAGGSGGGVYAAASSPVLINCILWNDTAPGGREVGQDAATPTISIAFSDIYGGFTGQGNINLDPRFLRKPSAGPDGNWATADDDYGDLCLQSSSPCINTGNNAAVPGSVKSDLAGNPRILGGSVDMGAYEAVDPANSIVAAGKMLVSIPASRNLELLRIDDQARVEVAAGAHAVVRVLNLIINGDGTLDVGDNTLLVGNTSVDAVAALIRSGRSGGAWTKPGITSSTARSRPMTGLAAVANNQGEVVVKYTWDGDANLDGLINADDYFQIDSGYITQAKGWYNGDFNYDDIINADDYFLIDSAFIGQTGPLAASKPEPAVSADVIVQQQAKKADPEGILSQLFSTEPVL